MSCVFGLFYQFFNLFLIYVGGNLIGLLFVEAELLRIGTKQLLNEMSEGVIIMDQESGIVLFVNSSAKGFNIKQNRNLSFSLLQNDENQKFDKDERLFACIDMQWFREENSNAQMVIDKV